MEIKATLVPFYPKPDPRNPEDIPRNQSTRLRIFPDNGATICLGGPKHLHCMGLKESNLIPFKIRVVGGSTLIIQGWLPVQFSVGEMSTKQALYICNNIDKLYFSKAACIDVGILFPHFPTPITMAAQSDVNWMTNGHTAAVCLPNMEQQKSTKLQLPIRPEEPSFPANEENVKNLKKWLLKQFANSAFKTEGQFPAMSGKPAHIHLKEGAVPKVKHRPIPLKRTSEANPYARHRKGLIKTSVHWHSYRLVQHHGDYKEKGWLTDVYQRLSISEFTMQVRNSPHCLTFPAGNAVATQYQEGSHVSR